jgi:NADPH:quinone reductase-like Zn-dependent oxidoreductase
MPAIPLYPFYPCDIWAGSVLPPVSPMHNSPPIRRSSRTAVRVTDLSDHPTEEQVRAAVIRRSGTTPVLDQFADPQPGPGLVLGTLVAAALNPLDVAIVNGQIPFRRLQPPYVAGYEAVVQLGDGTRRYVGGPPAPYGTLGELVPVADSSGFPVPAALDPGLAAALGVAGLAGWVALDYLGHLQPGETVLVLGSTGTAGQLAVQSARILGAGRVVGAARGQVPGQAAGGGPDVVVDLADGPAVDAGLAAAAPGGYDVIVDFLWGDPASAAMNNANIGARHIQVGNSAGPTSMISASVIRNKLVKLLGQGMIAAPAEVRRSAYAQLVRHAVDGKLTLNLETTRLQDISQTWERLKTGPSRKLVVTP